MRWTCPTPWSPGRYGSDSRLKHRTCPRPPRPLPHRRSPTDDPAARRRHARSEALNDLIYQAAQEATETTPEAITKRLLDDIRIGRGDSR